MRPPVLRLSLLALLLLVPALLLSACGGSGGSSDEDQITTVINDVTTGTDAAACTTDATQQFLEQTEFTTGKDAVKTCEENQKDSSDDPSAVEISKIQVKGTKAIASVGFTGSSFDGQTLDVSLVKEGDQWKLDKIEDIPGFDVKAFAAAFEEQAKTGDSALPDRQAKCIGSQLAAADPAKLKGVILGGDLTPLVAVFKQCGAA